MKILCIVFKCLRNDVFFFVKNLCKVILLWFKVDNKWINMVDVILYDN